MFLSVLSKEEKYNYLDLLTFLLTQNDKCNEEAKKIIDRHRFEAGEEGFRYRRGTSNKDNLLKFFEDRSSVCKKIVFMNLIGASIDYDYYSVQLHDLIEEIRQSFNISDKDKKEINKIIYSERDVREKARRIISE